MKKIDPTHLKRLIGQNKIEQVFTELNAAAATRSDTAFQNKVTLIESRWKKLKEDQVKGILSTERQELANNRIKNHLITLLDKADQPINIAEKETTIAASAPNVKTKKASWKSILTILATSIAVMAGIAEITGYSFRDWWEQKSSIDPIDNSIPKPADTTSSIDTITKPLSSSESPAPAPIVEKDKKKGTEEPPVKKAKLEIQIKTQKGDLNPTFNESEEVHLFFKVNRPCKLRTIYRLADGMLILLDNDRFVNTAETNKWIELSDGFEVAAPFGQEELYIFAQEKDFPVLQTEEQEGYTIIKEGLPSTLSKTRGLKKKLIFAEDKLKITTKKNN